MQLTHTPSDTRLALKDLPVSGCSRSLYFDRFAQPELEKVARNQFFTDGFKAHRSNEKITAWKDWLGHAGLRLKPEELLFAELQSRLMINMAGGVMENAGLCLDRFGVPYIPGSAVKGCARRTAIQNLLEAREAKEPSDKVARLLADITLVFGWGKQDWSDNKKDDRFVSDFAYAVGIALWKEVSSQARSLLPKTSHFAGAVSFLPSYPSHLPTQDLELDVLTCHHPKYYEGKIPVALDDEPPNPVVFPAVAAGVGFAFVTLPLRGTRESLSQTGTKLHQVARTWLRDGLQTFGLGAKTAAGYGWFCEAGTNPRAAGSSGASAAETTTAIKSHERLAEHPLITQWRSRTQSPNFRAFRPVLAALKDDAELKLVFEAIIPSSELAKLKRSNAYWQSFVSHPDGAVILKRLKLELR